MKLDKKMAKQFIMLVGPPGSGKSTWVEKQNPINTIILSTDSTIDMVARERGLTYNDVFQDNMKFAEEVLKARLNIAIRSGSNIIWDQTNLTVKSRAKKLAQIPADYEKLAVAFELPREELYRRCAQRPEKTIPNHVLDMMIGSYQRPTIEEGFDRVQIIC